MKNIFDILMSHENCTNYECKHKNDLPRLTDLMKESSELSQYLSYAGIDIAIIYGRYSGNPHELVQLQKEVLYGLLTVGILAGYYLGKHETQSIVDEIVQKTLEK